MIKELEDIKTSIKVYTEKEIDQISEKFLNQVVSKLHENLEKPDEYNSDRYGNVYLYSGDPKLFRELGLIEKDDKRFTQKARDLYQKLSDAGMYKNTD